MKRILAVFFLLLLFVSTSVLANQIKQVDRKNDVPSFLGYVEDRVIVVMKPEAGRLNIQSTAQSVHIGDAEFDKLSDRFMVSKIVRQFNNAGQSTDLAKYHKLSFNSGELDEVVTAYENHPLVEKVEKIGIHALYATPNDGFYDPYQWYHNQANDDDIDSPEAWDIQTGSSSITLAILDSGTRYYHPDLGGVNASPTTEAASRGNMWINDAELNGAFNVDDDGNGYVDDWIGYDFIETTSNCWSGEDCGVQDNDPRDFNGHGTHCAGIVGMITNDGYGMAGVAGGWNNGTQTEYGNGVKVMALRIGFSYNHFLYGEVGVVYMDAAAEAFYYAADNGAKIASCSWGSSNSGGIAAAADYFIANGGLIFTAAGNDGSQTPSYLGGRSDVIAVAATDENDAAASFTTYGTWVDISAPGVGIYSTYHDHTDPATNYWAALDGTSMACPMAAATAAMIWSQNPGWTAAQVESQLYASAENIDAELSATYIGKMGAGRINLYDAVNTGPQCDLTADFSGTPTSGCASLLVNFTDLSTGTGIDGWLWDFGDGTGTSTAQNPSYTYNSPGTYSVSLTVSSSSQSCNDAVTKTGYITVDGGPTADFSGSPTSGIEPLTVNFTNASINATSYSWDFGDGVGTSTATNPSYTYNTAGTYTVTLTATNACGSDVNTKVDYITVNPCVGPTAGFIGSPLSGDYPLLVNFTDQSTNASSYNWNFGDGGTSTAANPSHTYTAAGTYTVTQTVTNACGTDQLVRTDYITVTEPPISSELYVFDIVVTRISAGGGNKRGQADVTIYDSNNQPLSGAVVTGNFNGVISESGASGTTNASGVATIVTNGTVKGGNGDICFAVTNVALTGYTYNSSLNNVTESCEKAGDIGGSCTATTPVADFSGSPTSGDAPLTVSFSDLSINSPDTWSWDFGDGGTSTSQNPSYQYSIPGTYTVSLTASNCAGSDVATKVDYITVTGTSAGTMYVSDMVVQRKNAGPNCTGQAYVTIVDEVGTPLANATVFTTATGPVGGNYSGVTDASGVALIETGKTKSCGGEWCFEVTNVTHTSNTYNPGANVVTMACESGPVYAGSNGNLLNAENNLPAGYGLSNYPNPFNPTTTITFNLPNADYVRLSVYNVIGQEVAVLADGIYNIGEHTVVWDATNFASGMYFYKMETSDEKITKKMLLIK